MRYLILLFAAFPALCDGLRVEPDDIVLAGPGATQRLLLTVERGGDEDHAADCRLVSDNPAVVAVQGSATVAGMPGEATIRATCGEFNTTATIKVTTATAAPGISFTRDLLSILTTKGCNNSSCHGSPVGKAGFKLSLYGSDPAADHRMIAVDRRINRAEPAASLLLRKPSFQVSHGGGQLLALQSDEYNTIRQWIAEGATADTNAPRMKRLDLYPRERILAGENARQPIVVIGRLSDGTTRDLTGEVRYTVLDEGVIAPPRDAVITARRRGLTVLTARARGLTATAQFAVIERRASSTYPRAEANNFIDDFVFAKLRRVNITPFPLSDDHVFLRRVFLDTVGLLPTADETRTFLADAAPDKRARLIDNLLDRDAYASHWLTKFEDWFRNSQYYSQGRTNGSYKRWLRDLIAADQPYDQAVREMLTATGDTTVRPAGNFWHPAIDFMLKTFEVSKATPTVTRLFLGQRIECAECHNHPLENLTQDDFYGMAAFFARTKVKHGYGQYRRVWFDTREGEVLHPVTKQPVAPRLLDGTTPSITGDATRREVLADWITRTQQQQFARATVNRIWAEYFTLGIVEPADDFRSTNRPSHPELLDRLALHFISSGFRFKALHRLILNSRTYQLAAHTPDRPGGTDPLERALFARYEPRKLPAEALLDAISQVTGVPQQFNGYPVGTSPKELIASIGATHFLTTFGFPRRDVMEPRPDGPSLGQALLMMNNEAVRGKLAGESSVLTALLDQHPDNRAAVNELYLRALMRPPTERQLAAVSSFLDAELTAGRTRRRAFENLLWAILNSKEFQLNQ